MSHVPSRSKTLISLLALSLIGMSAVATATPTNSRWMSLSVGMSSLVTPAAVDVNWDIQTIKPLNYAPQSSGNAATALLGYGYQYHMDSAFLPAVRIGGQYQYLAAASVKGKSTNSTLPDYTYQDNVSSNVLWLDAQFDLVNLNRFTPYVEVGAGAAYNSFSKYSETYGTGDAPVGGNGLNFGSKSSLHVAYKAGVGVNYGVPIKAGSILQVGVFYNYVDFGGVSSAVSSLSGNPQLTQNMQGNEYGLAIRYAL